MIVMKMTPPLECMERRIDNGDADDHNSHHHQDAILLAATDRSNGDDNNRRGKSQSSLQSHIHLWPEGMVRD